MNVLCILLSVVVAAQVHYHERIGIPLAARIKTYEDEIFANPQMQSRVTDGGIAPAEKYPFMASLIIRLQNSNNVSLCGSSIVTNTRLVTAAHCLDMASSVKARFGSPFLFYGGIEISSRNFSQHPDFNGTPRHLDNDIGVVRLPRQLEFSDSIKPICLPCSGEHGEVGEWAMTAGWGLTRDAQRDKPFDNNWRLSEVTVEIVDETLCEKKYLSYQRHGKIVCTDGVDKRATCDGDSGGPLVIDRNGRQIMIGVVSNGYIHCEASWPTVYTKTLPYKTFMLYD